MNLCVKLLILLCIFLCINKFVYSSYVGTIYKMSRNKDKYENNNPRRQQTFMSQEDVAAGRKSFWHGVEITGKLIKWTPRMSIYF